MVLPRVAGVTLGAIAIGAALWEAGAPAWVWAMLLVNAAAWPPLAWQLAQRSAKPYRAERRNLALDSAMAGAWIAAMHFNLAPSVVLASLLIMDKAAVGGLKFAARCLAVLAAAAALVALAAGIEPQILQSGNVARLASVPLLVVYPIMVSLTTHRLAQRVRQQNRLLMTLSATDGLTSLPNHGAWLESVEREFARCRRVADVSSVLMIDLDHFKVVNDTHGHAMGDAVLRQVAEILRGTLRVQDVPGRYGGEEFGVVLPGSDLAGAYAIAERVRKRIEAADFGRGVRCAASIGCAALGPAYSGAAAWVARADRALYRAKNEGRNRCVRDEG
jgi:diguanylate cyclase